MAACVVHRSSTAFATLRCACYAADPAPALSAWEGREQGKREEEEERGQEKGQGCGQSERQSGE